MLLKKTLIAGLTGALFASTAAMASEPTKLTDAQMDDVSAGFLFAFASTGGFLAEFGSATDNGAATFEEISTTFQSSASSLSAAADGSGSAAESATAEAFSSIFGTFNNATLGQVLTGSALSFNGRF